MTQLSAWQRWLLRHSCHPSTNGSALLSALLPGLHCVGYSYHSGRTLWGFKRPRNCLLVFLSPHPARSSGLLSTVPVSVSFSLLPCLVCLNNLPSMLWCADLSDMLVCRLSVICWAVGVQLFIVARGDIKGDHSCHDASDLSHLLFYDSLITAFWASFLFSIRETWSSELLFEN